MTMMMMMMMMMVVVVVVMMMMSTTTTMMMMTMTMMIIYDASYIIFQFFSVFDMPFFSVYKTLLSGNSVREDHIIIYGETSGGLSCRWRRL